MSGNRARDSQRSKAYAAEDAVFMSTAPTNLVGNTIVTGDLFKPGWTRKFRNIRECDLFISDVLRMQVFVRRYGKIATRPLENLRTGRRCKAIQGHTIILGSYGYSDWMCCHELAHIIQWRCQYGRARPVPDVTRPELFWRLDDKPWPAGHGWEWASIYLDLVKFAMGHDQHDALQQSFKTHKVRFRPKRVMSLAQREMLAARLQFRPKAEQPPDDDVWMPLQPWTWEKPGE